MTEGAVREKAQTGIFDRMQDFVTKFQKEQIGDKLLGCSIVRRGRR